MKSDESGYQHAIVGALFTYSFVRSGIRIKKGTYHIGGLGVCRDLKKLEQFRRILNNLEYSGIFWNVLDCFGMFWNFWVV